MIVAIQQPNFLPWLGFFHKLLLSDVFVLFDVVQFPRGKSFCNRVKIKTSRGVKWLTIPVEHKGQCLSIKDITIANQQEWQKKHLKTIWNNYHKAPYYDEFLTELIAVYQRSYQYLASFNIDLIHTIARFLGAKTRIVKASDIIDGEGRAPQLIQEIIKTVGADRYLAGGGAGHQRYSEEITGKGFDIIPQNFHHPRYNHIWGGFEENLSIIDLIFNHGKTAVEILLKN